LGSPDFFVPVWKRDWTAAYSSCPTWKERFQKAQSSKEWPTSVKVFRGQMFFEEKLCIPISFQNEVIHEYHEFLGHVGPERTWKHIALRFHWADEKGAQKFCQNVCKKCAVCQCSSRGETLKGPIESTPIPPAPMTSVAIDLFKMPQVLCGGEVFDMMAVCVDRHSGWVVAIPCLEKGLTGAKLAKLMVRDHWRPFGIPSIISSDQGSHFVSNWWSQMCASLGIRQAFSQAYHHQANGRVERAGQQILEILRKLNSESKINWVEALPQVLDRIHDVKGESGLSPYEILFGRVRPLAGMPYDPPRECEDAHAFFSRMADTDQKFANVLNRSHEMLGGLTKIVRTFRRFSLAKKFGTKGLKTLVKNWTLVGLGLEL
jgi:hypothetical protein